MRFLVFFVTILCLISCKESPKVLLSDSKKSQESNASGEQYRPLYHFTPPTHWMNDPNGLIYYEGEYHLFYQYYPEDNVWGPMHWGHAVSEDLVHWKHLPIALYPDEQGYIFSGSAVVDWQNTSGFGTKEQPALVAIFTYHEPKGAETDALDFQTQAIAYSLDKGRTWVKYEGNPVLKNPGIRDFRDPKVIWDEDSGQWVMSLAVKDHINFYTSPNLLNWKLASEFGKNLGAHGGVWECPDLFPLVDSQGMKKWVLIVSLNPGGPQGGSASQYFVGDFNGKTFTPDDTQIRWVDYGADNYAGVTFSDIPEEDGRRIFIGWMSNWQYAQVVPTYTWRSAMTLPRSLELFKDQEGYLLQSKPVDELKALLGTPKSFSGEAEISDEAYLLSVDSITQTIQIVLKNDLQEYVIFRIENDSLVLDRTSAGDHSFHKAFSAVHKAPILVDQLHSLNVFVDRSSIEIFVNDGEQVMTDLLFPTKSFSIIEVSGTDTFDLTPIHSPFNN